MHIVFNCILKHVNLILKFRSLYHLHLLWYKKHFCWKNFYRIWVNILLFVLPRSFKSRCSSSYLLVSSHKNYIHPRRSITCVSHLFQPVGLIKNTHTSTTCLQILWSIKISRNMFRQCVISSHSNELSISTYSYYYLHIAINY